MQPRRRAFCLRTKQAYAILQLPDRARRTRTDIRNDHMNKTTSLKGLFSGRSDVSQQEAAEGEARHHLGFFSSRQKLTIVPHRKR